MSLPEVYIVSAARTPIGIFALIALPIKYKTFFHTGSFQGAFNNVTAQDLGAIVIKEVVQRANLKNEDIDEVIFGQALQAACGQNAARQASIKAGLPVEVPAYSINMLCGSGLKSVGLGFQAIRCRDSNIVICGGQERYLCRAFEFKNMLQLFYFYSTKV